MSEPGRSADYHIIYVKYNHPLRNKLGVNRTQDGFTYSIADMKPGEIKISDLIDNIWTYNRESVFEPNGIDRNELQIMADGSYGHEVVLDEGSIVRETIDTHTNYKLLPYVGTTTAPPLADDDFEARVAALQAQAPLAQSVDLQWDDLAAQHPVLPSGGDQATGSVDQDFNDLEARFYALVGRNIDGGGRRHMKRKSKKIKSKKRKSKRRKSKTRKSKTRRK